MVEVEILGQVITHQYGVLNSGDVLRTNAEFAKHLVEDCNAARYRTEVAAPAAAVEPEAEQIAAEPALPTKSGRAKK